MQRLLGAALAIVTALALVGQFRMPLNGDSAYVIDVARRMLDGAVLYRDIVDVNPPFVFWASLPAAALGGDGPGAMLAWRVLVIAVAVGALALAWPLTRGQPLVRAGYVLFALVLPVGYFGQREHLMFALTFPYLALAAARAGRHPEASAGERGRPEAGAEAFRISRTTALAAGALAALGVAIKPTAVVVPVVVALYLAIRDRSARPLGYPEHLAGAAGLTVAALLVVALAPGYAAVVRDVAGPYADFNREPLGVLLARDVHMWAGWLAIGLGLAFAGRLRAGRAVRVHLLAVAGFFGSAVLQGKGFGYHYFPVVGWAGIVLIELAFGTESGTRRLRVMPRVLAVLALAPMLYLFGAVTWRRAGNVYTRSRAEQAVVDSLVGPEPVRIAILSARMADAYPLVPERGHRMVLSFPQLWAAAVPVGRSGTAEIRRRYGEDIERGRAEAIVVRNPAPEARHTGDIAVDYLEYLCHDAVARRALGRYRLAARGGGFDLYRLDASGPQACASS